MKTKNTDTESTTSDQVVGCSDLLACPFCGSPAKFESGDLGYDDHIFYVQCSNNENGRMPTGEGCGTLGPGGDTRNQAMDKWNKRNSRS